MGEQLKTITQNVEEQPTDKRIGFLGSPFGKFFVGYGICRFILGAMDYAMDSDSLYDSFIGVDNAYFYPAIMTGLLYAMTAIR